MSFILLVNFLNKYEIANYFRLIIKLKFGNLNFEGSKEKVFKVYVIWSELGM